MMFFLVLVNVVNWGLALTNGFRYTLAQAIDANELAGISVDAFWRSNQHFYMIAPVQFYAILKGIRQFFRYRFYGIDITHCEEEVRGNTAMQIVKHWTLLLVVGPIFAWLYYFLATRERQANSQNAFAACVVLTVIGLDVLHPCAFLWFKDYVDLEPPDEIARKMSWAQAVTNTGWWRRALRRTLLSPFLTGLLKYVGPAYFVLLPFSCMVTTYFGVNAAFMLVVP